MVKVVKVEVSEPCVKIAGGWTGLRPVGRRRTYRAEIDGVAIVQESKSEVQRLARQRLWRAGHRGAVQFKFIEAAK
jgi:hypothetical protein